ncbi:toprim domain-containing protein [Desulfoprunum benzoelyticum]|uniref:DNA primase/helicase Gp4 N-terminal Bacteriophage T7-like domain-containing protein n=1 Tax=Desulfoprunum benzoelyticum TaxID=1506996 RepID=A0A840UXT7_9BACT|nr:primase-helicase zinc-binding domain-containing protein [Desulfoprunum benzoelyticum]MBB5348264.1 hypothetical protein [Desulfoprunum benzoelyticum]MBM9529543.1 toprim domain-containing protein [Desulfoprunum benzoelyticum]
MLTTLLESDGFLAKRKGPNEYASSCPACGGRDRFIVRTDGNARYWCRQCDISGDTIEYLRKFRAMPYREAAEFVGKHIDEPVTRKIRQDDRSAPITPPSDIWLKKADQLTTWAHDRLLRNDETLNWLETERGLNRETAKKFRLGWIDRDVFDERGKWGLPETGKKMLIPSGLTIPGPGRIRIRRNNPGDYGRYHVLPGSSSSPLTIGDPYENVAVIVESELDAILLCQEIRRPVYVVATGTTSIKPDSSIAAELVMQLNECPVVLIAMDTDDPGSKAARQWLDEMHNSFRAMVPAELGKDITDAYLQGMDLNIWISAAVDLYCDEITAEHDNGENDFFPEIRTNSIDEVRKCN